VCYSRHCIDFQILIVVGARHSVGAMAVSSSCRTLRIFGSWEEPTWTIDGSH
jgi:hypothetical protein